MCPHCQQLAYCSQYCREVHWTLNHSSICRSKKEQSTVLCTQNRFPEKTSSNPKMMYSEFETLPIQISHQNIETTAEITKDLCYPTSLAAATTTTTTSSSSSTSKKKSFRTLLSLLRVHGKRR